MQRRRLLQGLGTAALAANVHTTLWAAPAAGSKFLLVFLRGGYDAASLLVPVGSDFYYASRPNVAIARPGDDPDAALPLTADWGLHPALRESLWPLYRQGQLAFVPFAGTDDLTRSHFETQDSIELGQPTGGRRAWRSGFLNRLAGALNDRGAMAFTDQLPLSLQGSMPATNLALRSVGRPSLDARQRDLIAAMYRGAPLDAAVREGFSVRAQAEQAFAGEMAKASRGAAPARGFEQEARRIARMMRSSHDLGFVDVGGWDTHVGQGGATGYLAARLGELARGLRAYADEMGPDWRRTTVVVLSEFGRTFRENGNRGTDHGHGSVYWVLGGAVRGGRIAGEQQAVTAANLLQNRDWPVLNDYRALLGGVFARTYGLKPAQLARVFPQAAPRDMGLV